MKNIYFFLVCLPTILFPANTHRMHGDPNGFLRGTVPLLSINTMAFGNNGILFLGDSKSASVFAVDTKDTRIVEKSAPIEIRDLDKKIAAVLGTEVQDIVIEDMKVNPLSKMIYFAIHAGDGKPVVLRLEGDELKIVSLQDVSYSAVTLNNAVDPNAKDEDGNSTRQWAISCLSYSGGKVLVSGLSNEEFGSTFRSIPFPFNNKQQQSSLEIYHASHGRYETLSPIRTFTVGDLNGKEQLIASYTCTPLVLFPLEQLAPGVHVKGRTVAEMGAGNVPTDMITMKKGNDAYLIIANSNRPVFKIQYKDIESYQGKLTSPLKDDFGTEGVHFTELPLVNVLQLDKLDDTQFLLLQRRRDGNLMLWSSTEHWNMNWF
jgi:hypothetical protein